MPAAVASRPTRPQSLPPDPHLETFSSDQIRRRLGERSGRSQIRADARWRLRQLVPSATWYNQTVEDAGVVFPVPGMLLSRAKTRFPHDEDERGARVARRFFPPHALPYEDYLDGMSVHDATEYRAPPAWSAQLIAQLRPPADWRHEHFDDVTVLRSVRIADYPKRKKPMATSWRRARHYVNVSWPELQDVDPQGPTPIIRPSGKRLSTTEPLTWPWAAGEFAVLEIDRRAVL